jgi:hypothetical protein
MNFKMEIKLEIYKKLVIQYFSQNDFVGVEYSNGRTINYLE